MEEGIAAYGRYLEGDKNSFATVVRVYGDALTAFARGFLKDYSSAEDVMMDVFASLIVKPKTFGNEKAFKTYLFKCARNGCIDKLRAAKRTAPFEFAENLPLPTEYGQEELAIKKSTAERAAAAIDELPKQYRDVIYLVYYEEFSVDETAKILKKNKKQIYNALARAKLSLKNKLKEVYYE